MRISDWSSDVCSSDLEGTLIAAGLSASSTSVPSKSRKSAASARSAAGGARSGTAMRPVGKPGGETQVALFQHLAGIGAPEMVGADIAFAALNIEAAPVVRAIGQAADHPGLGEKANLRALRRRFAPRTRFVAGNAGRARVAGQVDLLPRSE